MNESTIVSALTDFISSHGMPRKQAAQKAKETADVRMGSNELRRTLFIQEAKKILEDNDTPYQIVEMVTAALNNSLNHVDPGKNEFRNLAELDAGVRKHLQTYGVKSIDISKTMSPIFEAFNRIYSDD